MNHRFPTARRWLPGACLAWLGIASLPAAAADATAGAELVGRCVACHGADGIGKAPQYPNLQGQKAAYLVKALKAYRSGERNDPNMAPMARGLSDADIASLAAYFENAR